MRRPALTLVLFPALLAATVPFPAHAASRHRAHRHHTAPTTSQVEIAATTLAQGESTVDIGPSRWSVQGEDLRTVLAAVYGIDSSRIEIAPPPARPGEALEASMHPASTAPLASTSPLADRIDISLPLSGAESDEQVQQTLRRAIEARFHVQLRFELRTVNAYILTAPTGAGPALVDARASLRRAAESLDATPMQVTVSGQLCPDASTLAISAHAATLGALASALEDNLNAPVVDETHLAGRYNFQLTESTSREDLFRQLQAQLGITISQAPREVEVLTVQPEPASATELRASL